MRSRSGRISPNEVLLTALGTGAICFFISLYVLVAIAFNTGMLELHLFEASPSVSWREDITWAAILGISILAGWAASTFIFRLGEKWFR
jgi:hypothetical protein